MRRTPYLLLVMLMLSAVICSCSREEEPKEEEKEKKEDSYETNDWENVDLNGDATMAPSMRFCIAGNGSLSDPETATRGGSDVSGGNYAFAVNDLVTISVAGKGTKVYKITDASTGKLDYTGTVNDAFHWNSTSESIDVTAWSLGNAEQLSSDPNGQAYQLEADQSANGYRELLYMSETSKSYGSDGSVSLTLTHTLSRLMITVTQDAASAKTISSVTIGDGVGTLPTKAVFSPADAKKWTAVGTEKGVITPKTEAANTKYSAVLIPTTYASGLKLFNIVIGSETFAYVLPSSVELLAGKQYNYTVTVKNGVLSIVGCTITNWGSGANGGTVTINTLP